MTIRAAVFASGRGSNFEVLADAGAARVADAAGRGGVDAPRTDRPEPSPPPWEVVLLVTDRTEAGAVERAERRGIPVAVVPPEKEAETFAERLLDPLRECGVEIVLLAGYLRLVPSEVVRAFPNRILNLHPALLPGFGGKGMYGVKVHRAILDAGARVSGATVHFVDEQYDRGPILAQWPVPVLDGDTPDTLAARVLEVEHALYPAAVDSLAAAVASGASAEAIPARGRHFVLSSDLPSFP